MRLTLKFLSILLILVVGSGPGSARPAFESQFWLGKIDQQILSAVSEGETEFILYLSEQADLGGASYLKTKGEKGQYVFESLITTARRSQRPIVEELTGLGVDFRPYWIANMIWVRGDINVLSAMARRSDVDHVFDNPKVQLEKPVSDPNNISRQSNSSIEWNIIKVRAPEVWAEGYQGQGIVIGGQDTGYEWDHPALKSQYRGWDGTSVDHNYNWHDAIHTSTGNPCGSDSPVPCDDHFLSHGTHTMGTIVGEDASLNHQIGMAPKAEWIGCRNMDQGLGSPVTYAECYQWFLAPTDLNNLNPDPAKAPHVINNSWSCPEEEGCVDPQILQSVVEAVRASGILTVHSAGNKGSSGCSTINTPAAIYDASFTVGNTNSSDTIAASSSRGPVAIDGSGRIKPDISAPGTSVLSSVKGGGYAALSGTSMAAPHVAGLAALLFSAQPELIGQVDQTEWIITRSAVPVQVDPNYLACGGIPGDVYPNNFSGYGRIDALNAYLYGGYELFFPWLSRE